MTDGKQNTKIWLETAVFALICLLFALFFNRCSQDYFVENNDNFGIACVVNNTVYDNYCIFLNPLLCGIIRNTALVLPKADAFALTSLVLCELAFIWCAFLAFKHTNGLKRFVFITIAAVYASFGIFAQNFTVTAAFLGAAGFIPIMIFAVCGTVFNKKYLKIYLGISLFFVAMGFMYRGDDYYLFIPFAALCVAAAILINKNKNNFRGSLLVVAVSVFVTLVSVGGIALLADLIPAVDNGKKFNKARAFVQDYPLLPYEEAGFGEDITENDYTLITHFMTPDTERMDTDFLRSFAQNAADPHPDRAKIIKDTFVKNKYTAKPLILLSGAVILLLFTLLSKGNIVKKLTAAISFAGILLGMAALLYVGRLPERVMLLIITAGICPMCAVFYSIDINNEKISKAGCVLCAFICIAAFARFAVKDIGGRPTAIFTAYEKNAQLEEAVSATYTEGCVFIWDTINYNLAPSMYFSTNGKLLPREFEMHNIPAGGWSYGQLYQKQRFDDMGIRNPAYDLVYRPNTFYVGELSVMETYIKEHIEPNAKSDLIGYILNTPVYVFTVEEQ